MTAVDRPQATVAAARTSRRIGFVSTRFAGTDGVSLETAKWATVLEELGHTCFYFAGECDRPADRSRVVPEAFYRHPEIEAINRLRVRRRAGGRGLDPGRRPRRSPGAHEQLDPDPAAVGHPPDPRAARALQARAARLRRDFDLDLLVDRERERDPAQPAARARDRGAGRRDRDPDHRPPPRLPLGAPALPRERVPEILAAAFPPSHPSIRHVVINSVQASALASRHGLTARVVPNVMEFERPPGPPVIDPAVVRARPRRRRGRAAPPAADAGHPAQGDRARDRVHAPARAAGLAGHLARRRRRGPGVRGSGSASSRSSSASTSASSRSSSGSIAAVTPDGRHGLHARRRLSGGRLRDLPVRVRGVRQRLPRGRVLPAADPREQLLHLRGGHPAARLPRRSGSTSSSATRRWTSPGRVLDDPARGRGVGRHQLRRSRAATSRSRSCSRRLGDLLVDCFGEVSALTLAGRPAPLHGAAGRGRGRERHRAARAACSSPQATGCGSSPAAGGRRPAGRDRPGAAGGRPRPADPRSRELARCRAGAGDVRAARAAELRGRLAPRRSRTSTSSSPTTSARCTSTSPHGRPAPARVRRPGRRRSSPGTTTSRRTSGRHVAGAPSGRTVGPAAIGLAGRHATSRSPRPDGGSVATRDRVDAEAIRVVPNGIDVEAFLGLSPASAPPHRPAAACRPPDRSLLAPARITPRKHLELAIAVVAEPARRRETMRASS